MTATLFHLVTRADWSAYSADGASYAPPSLAREGFIHLSTAAQWPLTRARFYQTAPDLLLVELAPANLDIRYEPADHDHFPHLYSALPLSAVVAVTPLD